MHIVILQGAFFPIPPLLGGAVEKAWSALGPEFARLGHQVTHISRRHPGLPAHGLRDGVRDLRVRGHAAVRSLTLLKLLDLLYTIRAVFAMPRADVIVTNTFWAPILLQLLRRGRILVSVERMPRWQMRAYARCSRLRAPSRPVAEAILRIVPQARTVVIPNPLPAVPSDIDPSAKAPVVLFAGRIHPEKGLHLLVPAFRSAVAHHPGWRLVVAGPHEIGLGGGGPGYLRELQALAGEAPITWAGMITDHQQLNRLYADSAIFAYPSLAAGGETFGMAVLESMAAGCAPIVSALPCFSDFIVDGANGLVADLDGVDPVRVLAGRLSELMGDDVRRQRIAGLAMAVRGSHATRQIAMRFIEEFTAMQNEAP